MELIINVLMKWCFVFWPMLVTGVAFLYQNKQNGPNPMTGGPISTPKSFWLAYTITTWFFLPIFFIAHPLVSFELKMIVGFHLTSWWLRGPIELVMIYKFFNWTPKYGITHDAFHVLGLIGLTLFYREQLTNFTPYSLLAFSFVCVTIFATFAEILFAYLFLKARSESEEKDNIYFASDDPKWIFINRVTLSVVIVVMLHLVTQSLYALLKL
jgi:hypothetical protein